MIKVLLLSSILIISNAFAYVPSVESLFRNGANPDVTVNGIALTMSVKKINSGDKEETVDPTSETFYKMFFTKNSNDSVRVAQTRYSNSSFSEGSLEHKVYLPNVTPSSLKEVEKGLFIAMLQSILYNNGSFFVKYLKSIDVPVKLNNEILNREKIEYLASYKKYLATISKDREARKNEVNPLKPEDSAEKEKVDAIMNQPMYVDTNQVKLFRDEGEMVWMVSADNFEAATSYRNREIQKVRFKTSSGEYVITCKNFWLANGTHSVPRIITINDFKGEKYQVEITNLRHYSEKDIDVTNRVNKWNTLLKGKVSEVSRPFFLL